MLLAQDWAAEAASPRLTTMCGFAAAELQVASGNDPSELVAAVVPKLASTSQLLTQAEALSCLLAAEVSPDVRRSGIEAIERLANEHDLVLPPRVIGRMSRS